MPNTSNFIFLYTNLAMNKNFTLLFYLKFIKAYKYISIILFRYLA